MSVETEFVDWHDERDEQVVLDISEVAFWHSEVAADIFLAGLMFIPVIDVFLTQFENDSWTVAMFCMQIHRSALSVTSSVKSEAQCEFCITDLKTHCHHHHILLHHQ